MCQIVYWEVLRVELSVIDRPVETLATAPTTDDEIYQLAKYATERKVIFLPAAGGLPQVARLQHRENKKRKFVQNIAGKTGEVRTTLFGADRSINALMRWSKRGRHRSYLLHFLLATRSALLWWTSIT